MTHHKIGIFSAALAISGVTAGASGMAADAPGASAEKTPELLEIVVTGTSIPTAPDDVAVPVVTLDAAALDQSGVATNALEMLRKLVPAFEGRSNAGTSNANNNNQNTAGGSQLQLRNLPTLVLVNGRRVANSGIGGINGKNFVDVNQIPADAIDHVEVLTDGASSIYGSDAIGGVVNFVLKKDYEGLTAGLRAARAEQYNEGGVFLTGGTKIGAASVTATASLNHSDPLLQSDRPFSSPLYNIQSNIPGVVNGGNDILSSALSSPGQRNPTGAAATAGSIAALVANGTYLPTSAAAIRGAFNVAPLQTLLLRQNMDSFAGTFDMPLIGGHALEAFADVMLSRGRSRTNWLPVASAGNTVPAGAPYNPLTTAFPGVVFSNLAYGHDFFDSVNAERVTLGLRGEISSHWNWETAVVWSESDLEQQQTGLIYKPNLPLAIKGGFDASGNPVVGGTYSKVYGNYSLTGPLVLQPALDPFATAGVNPAALANVYGTETINAVSQLMSWDAKLVGRVVKLPAGDLDFAVGASLRRESLSGRTDADGRNTDPITGSTTGNDQQWLQGTYADPFGRHRTISGFFGEVRIPLTGEEWNIPVFHALDLTAAVRAERYSDAGNSTVPKFGFRWQPFDKQLTFRGNYAKSFIAPALYSEYGPTDTRQVGAAVIQGVFGANYAGMPINGEDGNNPNLQPATSLSKTIGFVVKPNIAPNLSVTVDFSDITLEGFQGGIGFNNILATINTLGSASPFFKNLAVDKFPDQGGTDPFTTPGALKAFLTNAQGNGDPNQANRLFLIDQFRNLATLIEQSWNMSVAYSLPTENDGTFSLSTAGTIFDSFKFQGLPNTAYIQYAGNTTNNGVFGGTLPRYRFHTGFDWGYHDLDLSVANTYVDGTNDTGSGGTSAPIRVSNYSAWDLRAAYLWRTQRSSTVKLAVGVNNLTDRLPPLAPRAFSDNNADVATFSPIGRLFYATVTFSL